MDIWRDHCQNTLERLCEENQKRAMLPRYDLGERVIFKLNKQYIQCLFLSLSLSLSHRIFVYDHCFFVPRSTPAELFYDFIEDLEEKYAKDKKKIKDIMRDNNIKVTQSTTFEEWMAQLNSHEKFTSIEANHLRILFDEVRCIEKRHLEFRSSLHSMKYFVFF
jgi:hypothetical protein